MMQARSTTVLVVTRVQKRFHMRSLEWFLALVTMSVALEFALFPHLFASQPYYAELLRFAPQEWWAVAMLVAGLARVVALLINGAWRFSPHARSVVSVFNAIAWMLIWIGLAHIGRPSLGAALCPCLMAADCYSIFRAAGDAQSADAKARAMPALA